MFYFTFAFIGLEMDIKSRRFFFGSRPKKRVTQISETPSIVSTFIWKFIFQINGVDLVLEWEAKKRGGMVTKKHVWPKICFAWFLKRPSHLNVLLFSFFFEIFTCQARMAKIEGATKT